MSPPSTAQVIRMIDAARLVGFSEPEQFRVAAKRAGVVGRRGRHGHIFWSEADVAAVCLFHAPKDKKDSK